MENTGLMMPQHVHHRWDTRRLILRHVDHKGVNNRRRTPVLTRGGWCFNTLTICEQHGAVIFSVHILILALCCFIRVFQTDFRTDMICFPSDFPFSENEHLALHILFMYISFVLFFPVMIFLGIANGILCRHWSWLLITAKHVLVSDSPEYKISTNVYVWIVSPADSVTHRI